MSWCKITCEERDAIYHADRPESLRPLSSCTDMSGQFHGDPQIDITWGIYSTDTPVLRETRYPRWYHPETAIHRSDQRCFLYAAPQAEHKPRHGPL
ncbi:hypothetical protein [Mycobacterium marinum]|uniref:hypothetical protein n=1 Tax=Mycobacterium marinum TaxID=1781 RepID=UPI0035664567